MIGTVPVYDSVIHYQRDLDTLSAKDFIDVIRLHAQDGVDFVTLHCGITRKTIDQIQQAQAQDEHRLPRRLAGVRLDEHDGRGKSLL